MTKTDHYYENEPIIILDHSQENTMPANYPKRYVESKFAFRLGEAAIAIEGALSLQLMQIAVAVQLRPGAQAFKWVVM